MYGLLAFLAATMCVIVCLAVLGVLVCILAVATNSPAVAIVGACAVIPFSFFVGYLVARALLRMGDRSSERPGSGGDQSGERETT
jgi:hypothetical protein